MPIFVSRFSPGRVAGANLQRLRLGEERERERTNAARRERRAEPARDRNDAQGRVAPGRHDEAFPAPTIRAELLQERLQGRGNGRAGSTDQNEGTASNTGGRRAGQIGVARRQLPAVGAVRGRADRDAGRPGRLGREPINPAVEQALNRFARLRAVGQEHGRAEQNSGGNAPGLPAVRVPQTPPLNQGLDARVRLLVAQARGRSAQGMRQIAPQPTAREISRANTAPEIRQNLQADIREVEQGLRRDAARQAGENMRRTVRGVQHGIEARRENKVRSNEAEARELKAEERRLERELAQTQREIRDLENSTGRLRGPATRGAARAAIAAAAALGSRVNLLAV